MLLRAFVSIFHICSVPNICYYELLPFLYTKLVAQGTHESVEIAPYFAGRGQELAQEFNFTPLDNVFEALKFGYRVSLVCI